MIKTMTAAITAFMFAQAASAATMTFAVDGPQGSVGPPDANISDPTTFASIGLGGEALLTFGGDFTGQISIWEFTLGDGSWQEAADVFGSSDGITFDLIGSVTNSVNPIMLNTGGTYSILRIVDTTALVFPNSPALDATQNLGYDIDAVQVMLVDPAAIPLPASMPLMIGGLAVAGYFVRRRKSA